MKKNIRSLWSDDELQAALDAYLYMLQMELSSIPFSAAQQSNVLLTGPLSARNSASIRYRMRNISAIIASKHLPTLSSFSPAEQVGRNVRAKLEALLATREETLAGIRGLQTHVRQNATNHDILRALEQLKDRLSGLEAARPVGIGHNNPPGELEFSSEEVRSASSAVEAIALEVSSERPERERLIILAEFLSSFGLKASVWTGQRVTDFAKASAITAGSGFGLHLSGLGEQILSTLRLVFHMF